MTVYLRSLETAVPPTVLIQTEARDVFAAQPGLTRLGSRLVTTCFDSAAIETRHTAVEEMTMAFRSDDPQFFDPATGLLLNPSTKVRNEVFAEQATALFIESAQAAVDACPDLTVRDITHVITVSCTGFFNPGPDYKIVRALGLDPAVQRYHLGFMGCYAAFPALRAAKSFCEADPQAVVLVVCAELCSLHVRTSNDPDTIMGSALFADGAAAAIVTAQNSPEAPALLQLDHFETVLTPVGEESMAWNIGDHGFEMVLGNYVPHIIDDHIVGALEPLLSRDGSLLGLPYRDIRHWAIHPGGRSILDKVQARLELTDKQLVPARETLRRFGNMSSATVLFVLKNILALPAAEDDERICSMAFGPGLTVESGLFTKLRQAGSRGPAAGRSKERPKERIQERATAASGAEPALLMRQRDADAAEFMDAPDCDPAKLERTYRQFGLVNRLFSGWKLLYVNELRPVLSANTVTTVLDIGSGGGDLARLLARWSQRDRLRLDVTGIDPDSRAYSFAASRPNGSNVRFLQADSGDVAREGRRFDAVISNHVLHHLQPPELAQLLTDSRTMARRICLHNDLRRSAAAYGLFSLAALPFRGSFIRADGLTSIRRSYTPAELGAAAPPGWSVQRHPPFHQVLIHRPGHPDD